MPSHDAVPRHSTVRLIVNVVVSVAVLGSCFYAYTLLGERKRPQRSKPQKPAATVVTSVPLASHEGPVKIGASGVVVPLREIRLATEVTGRVVQISPNLRNGRMVDAGEVLIRLDSIEYDLEVKRLKAQQSQEAAELVSVDVSIENATLLLALAEQQVDITKGERDRIDSLIKRQAASGSEADIARRSELTSKAALVELQNRRRELIAQRQLIVEKQSLTQIALQRAQLDQSRTTVKSPIRGRVVSSTVETDSYLLSGTSFVTIEDTSAVEVRCSLTASQMIWVWRSAAGMSELPDASSTMDDRVPPIPAIVEHSFGGVSQQWTASLERIDGAGIDLDTRTYPCLFRVNDPRAADARGSSNRLMRGMFVSVTLMATPDRPLFQVPETAIRPGNRLWLDDNHRLRIQNVHVVARSDDGVIVDMIESPPGNGVADASSSVVISPISDPSPGMALMSEPIRQPASAGIVDDAPAKINSAVNAGDSVRRDASAGKVDG
ncbi:multidrug resistance protein MdtN [Rubripirellula lacrimiformis]|uniref:Multidrug resistance protein MdtN n=1 Tax=Rubripirellula lacrimiformis TaxID=1930273 RepID=A0A517NFL3_9BACT|nr:multidrug resistance protein MdtN [Rubripirellula lacrimiformis]